MTFKIIDGKRYIEIDGQMDEIPQDVADAIYRSVWYDHVMEDIRTEFTDEDSDEKCSLDNGKIGDMAYRYVYEGEYDCNIPYWDQLRNLI